MSSARRARAVARPRQVAMYLAKQLTSRSLPEIGRKFGNRDHTTVMHAVQRVGELMARDAELRRGRGTAAPHAGNPDAIPRPLALCGRRTRLLHVAGPSPGMRPRAAPVAQRMPP